MSPYPYKPVSKPKENILNTTNMHHTGAATLEYPSVQKFTQLKREISYRYFQLGSWSSISHDLEYLLLNMYSESKCYIEP